MPSTGSPLEPRFNFFPVLTCQSKYCLETRCPLLLLLMQLRWTRLSRPRITIS